MSYIPGIDVSHWQGKIDWPPIKAAGKAYVFIKATDGVSYVDAEFAANWQSAKVVGLLRGAYHFFRPLKDSLQQAQLFCSTVTLEDGDLPPVLDLEVSDNLTSETIIPRVQTWLTEVERLTGRKPIIYSGVSYLNENFTTGAGGPPPWADDYILWIANYLDPSATQPYMPRGWKKWTFWQHSASGKVNGVISNVDLDWFDGTLEELQALAGKKAAPGPKTYTVTSGDTWKAIADRLQVDLADLVQANPQLLQAGLKLNLPTTASSGGSSGTRSGGQTGSGTGAGGTSGTGASGTIYIVRAGDTLGGIASRFNTTAQALAQANNITDPNMIKVGQRLIIP